MREPLPGSLDRVAFAGSGVAGANNPATGPQRCKTPPAPAVWTARAGRARRVAAEIHGDSLKCSRTTALVRGSDSGIRNGLRRAERKLMHC